MTSHCLTKDLEFKTSICDILLVLELQYFFTISSMDVNNNNITEDFPIKNQLNPKKIEVDGQNNDQNIICMLKTLEEQLEILLKAKTHSEIDITGNFLDYLFYF